MKKIIGGVVGLSLLAWLLTLSTGQLSSMDVWVWRKQLIYWTGLASFLLMTLIMVLAVRPKWLEKPMGGLDKMYQVHKWAGIWAVSLAVTHYGLKLAKDPLLWIFEQGVKEPRLKNFLEIFRGSAKDLGEWAVWIFAIMVLIALWKRFPYHIFRYLHKAMAVFYLVIVFHSIVLTPTQWWLQPAGVLVALATVIGAYCAWLSLTGTIGRSRTYAGHVLAVKKYDASTFELTCQLPASWRHQAGQFAFLRFAGLSEPHPFTIASADHADGQVRFSIKALGDYTADLARTIEIGQQVQVEGPYGNFTLPKAKAGREQIWIAGGIGVTPFIAWLEALQQQPDKAPKARLYYCVNNAQEGVFAERLQQLCAHLPNIKLHIHYSDDEGFLTADKIFAGCAQDVRVWFCGPYGFSQALRAGMRKLGLSTRHFHQEAFQMR